MSGIQGFLVFMFLCPFSNSYYNTAGLRPRPTPYSFERAKSKQKTRPAPCPPAADTLRGEDPGRAEKNSLRSDRFSALIARCLLRSGCVTGGEGRALRREVSSYPNDSVGTSSPNVSVGDQKVGRFYRLAAISNSYYNTAGLRPRPTPYSFERAKSKQKTRPAPCPPAADTLRGEDSGRAEKNSLRSDRFSAFFAR